MLPMDRATRERLWLHEIRLWWKLYNLEYLGGCLREPSFRLLESVPGSGIRTYGTWNAGRREIGISALHIEADPWLEVAQTLRHEMAHQVADEVYGATDESPHGPAFQRASRKLRVDHLDPERPATPHPGRSRLVARVQKLLALSSSANEHEAALALRKARRLLLQHDLEPDRVGAGDGAHAYGSQWLGPIRKRHHAWEYSLGAVLQDHFGVAVLWTTAFRAGDCTRGTALEVYGTPEHLELAEHVHTVLWRLLPKLWDAHRRAVGIRSNHERQRFYTGVVEGFLSKLRRQDRQLQQEEGLVPVGDAQLDRFVRFHNPRIKTVRSGGGKASSAYSAGVQAGGRVSIDPALARREGHAAAEQQPKRITRQRAADS